MLEYYPWSKQAYNECLSDYLKGKYSILDIELGGQCNYHCIYCDSPNREKKCSVSLTRIEELFDSYPIKWVFVCGLGEPTASGNMSILLEILKLCEAHGAQCSIFTNLSNVGNDLLGYISRGVLNLLFKYDSSDYVKTMRLYGSTDVIRQIYNISTIKNYAYNENNKTHIAASIVPTRENRNEIITIVKDCVSNNIYPLIAELEDSGEAHEFYSQLALTDDELEDIKKSVEEILEEEYCVPVCPAVISGIHIRYDGKVTVDKHTGLSCHWFWLEEPRTHVIGDFNNESIGDLISKIEAYRIQQFPNIATILENKSKSVFGGCGGNVIALLQNYVDVFQRRYE